MDAGGALPRIDADVHVVVVVDERLHDAARSVQARVRPDEHELRVLGDEAVDEVLGETVVDVARAGRRQLAVAPRVEDVDVETVLVRDVPTEAPGRTTTPCARDAAVSNGRGDDDLPPSACVTATPSTASPASAST